MKGGRRYGAGRPASRPQTSWAARLNLRKMTRDGVLVPGATTTWHWSNGLLVTISANEASIELAYRYTFAEGERDVRAPVRMERTPCRFGGSRSWFNCPRCNRRVAMLYLWGYPACRTCCRMGYPSQSEDAIDRSWRRTRKIEERLGGEWPARKPKWMRQTTYDRLWEEGCREEEIRNEELLAFMARTPGLY